MELVAWACFLPPHAAKGIPAWWNWADVGYELPPPCWARSPTQLPLPPITSLPAAQSAAQQGHKEELLKDGGAEQFPRWLHTSSSLALLCTGVRVQCTAPAGVGRAWPHAESSRCSCRLGQIWLTGGHSAHRPNGGGEVEFGSHLPGWIQLSAHLYSRSSSPTGLKVSHQNKSTSKFIYLVLDTNLLLYTVLQSKFMEERFEACVNSQ